MIRARTLAITGMANVVLSATAVLIVVTHSSSPILANLAKFAERFASPGEMLWWATLGGAFQGYPTGPVGRALWILGTALFWFLVSVAILALVEKRFASASRGRRR